MIRKNGFTLLEVIFAMGILAVGLLGVASLLTTSVHQQKSALDDVGGQMFGENALVLARAAGSSPSLYPSTIDAYGKPSYLPAAIPAAFTPASDVFNAVTMYRRDTDESRIKLAIFAYRVGGSNVVVNEQDGVAMRDFVPRTISPPDPVSKFTASGTGYNLDIWRKQPVMAINTTTWEDGAMRFYTSSNTGGTAVFGGLGGNFASSPSSDTITNYTGKLYYLTDSAVSSPTAQSSTKAAAIVQGVIE